MDTTKRYEVIDGWAVVSLEDGSQVRARAVRDGIDYYGEPERGDGMWNEGVTLDRVGGAWRSGGPEDGHPGVEAWLRERNVHTIEDEEILCRYLRVFWDVQHAEVLRHTGYSPSDAVDVVAVVEGLADGANAEALARETFLEWSMWAQSDVYTLEVETRTLMAALDAEDTEDGWEESEKYGRIYGEEYAYKELCACVPGGMVPSNPGANRFVDMHAVIHYEEF